MSVAKAELHPNPENATLDELRVAMDAAPTQRRRGRGSPSTPHSSPIPRQGFRQPDAERLCHTVTKSYASAQSDLDQFDHDFYAKTFYDKLRLRLPSQSLVSVAGGLKRAMRTETDRSIIVCAIALKRYSIQNKKFPSSLNSLVPVFLSSVPIDYMDGKPMKYHLNADGSFTLYSVGENGNDDGGDVSLLRDTKSYRNLWDRKDFIWPAPALPDEVETWRKEEAKN